MQMIRSISVLAALESRRANDYAIFSQLLFFPGVKNSSTKSDQPYLCAKQLPIIMREQALQAFCVLTAFSLQRRQIENEKSQRARWNEMKWKICWLHSKRSRRRITVIGSFRLSVYDCKTVFPRSSISSRDFCETFPKVSEILEILSRDSWKYIHKFQKI